MAKNGEGSVYFERSSGRWVAAISVPGSSGFRRIVRRYPTEADARTGLINLRAGNPDTRAVAVARDPDQTVRRFLGDWLESIRPPVRKPSTWQTYEHNIRVGVLPYIGKLRMVDVRAQHLQQLYAARLAAGAQTVTVHTLHAILHRAFRMAVRWEVIPQSPLDRVEPPQVRSEQRPTLSEAQATALVGAADEHPLGALVVLALGTGMRQGEMLALRWTDVDLDAGTISITRSLCRTTALGFIVQTPKTRSSRRQVYAPRFAIDALRARHRIQLEERLAAPAWSNPDGLIFTKRAGTPLRSADCSRLLRRFLAASGGPVVRFHDLRHTFATLALAAGIPAKIVSDALGHANVGITLDLYSHVTPTMGEGLRDAMQAVFSGSRRRSV